MYKKLDEMLTKNKNSKKNLTKLLGYSEQKILTSRLKNNVEFTENEIVKINKWLLQNRYTTKKNFLKSSDFEKQITRNEKTITPIGKWLLIELKRADKSQQELALELDVSAPTITNWITGKYKVNQDNLNSLSIIFNEDLKKLSSLNNGDDFYISKDYYSQSYRLEECINNVYENIINYVYRLGYTQITKEDEIAIKKLIKYFIKSNVENYLRKKHPLKTKIDLIEDDIWKDHINKLKELDIKIKQNNFPEYLNEERLLANEFKHKILMLANLKTQDDHRVISSLQKAKKKIQQEAKKGSKK